jgi:hypothetical protein
MNFSPQAQVLERSPISRQSNMTSPHDCNSLYTNISVVTVTIVISIVDIAFNAAAGRFAALTGAKINSWSRSSATAHTLYDRSEIASLGAKTGLFKAAVLAVWHFGTKYGELNLPISLVFAMVGSRFGIAVLVTCLVSTLALGQGLWLLPNKT